MVGTDIVGLNVGVEVEGAVVEKDGVGLDKGIDVGNEGNEVGVEVGGQTFERLQLQVHVQTSDGKFALAVIWSPNIFGSTNASSLNTIDGPVITFCLVTASDI